MSAPTAKARKPPAPVKMWAVIVVNSRCDWIHYTSIARTRRAAWESFLALWDFEGQQRRREDLKAGHYRLARVKVIEDLK
ncbi:hypothetical protein [Nevskia sp.]|uniref:hypothetical protein n=1 Tax=Nevskia sp. TaxID=1929292 RepID=UPI0025DBB463|nr:hypothetical protein [Nevskia sp.]